MLVDAQLNVTSSDSLKAAQTDRGQYANLMMKVDGHNASFAQLLKKLQDSIIDTERDIEFLSAMAGFFILTQEFPA